MAFDGTEGSAITEAKGAQFTSDFRKRYPSATKGVFIGKDHLLDLLNRSGSKGIRVYFGVDEGGAETTVSVSAKANEDDDLGLIIDCGKKCPPYCGAANSLNS